MLKEDIQEFAKVKYLGSPSKNLIFKREDPAIEFLFHHKFEYAIGISYQRDYAIYSDSHLAEVNYDKKDNKIYGTVKEQFQTSSKYYGYLEIFLFSDALDYQNKLVKIFDEYLYENFWLVLFSENEYPDYFIVKEDQLFSY